RKGRAVAVGVDGEHGVPRVGRNEGGRVPVDADAAGAGAVPVADDDVVRRQAEGEDLIAAVHRVVVGDVQNELAGTAAVGVGTEDGELVGAGGVAVPNADQGLIARLAELERLAGVEDAVVVEVEVPGAVVEVADVRGTAAGPVAGHAGDARQAEAV